MYSMGQAKPEDEDITIHIAVNSIQLFVSIYTLNVRILDE